MTKNERIAALDEKIEGLHAHLASLAAEHDGEIAMLRAHCGIPRPDAPPADPAPASATLAVGDTVEVTGPTIARRINEIGRRGVITEHIPAGNSYQVDYADRPGIFCGAFPASSLRRVEPAPDVQPAAGYVAVSCLRHGTRNCPDCFGIAAPAEQPTPAADLRREIEAAITALMDRTGDDVQERLLVYYNTIRAAAAVPPVARPGDVESYAYDIGYNAGQSSILAPMLAALTQGGK